MQITRANCECLNENYLPKNVENMLLDQEKGWIYSKGKFSLNLKYHQDTLMHMREFAGVLRQFKIHPTLLVIHDDERYFNFIIYEDDILRSVYEQKSTIKIYDALQEKFEAKKKYLIH